jgi:hypothetical protein
VGERPDRARRADPARPSSTASWGAGGAALIALVVGLFALPVYAARPKKPEPANAAEAAPETEAPETNSEADEAKADAKEADAPKAGSKWDEGDKASKEEGDGKGEGEEQDPDELEWLSAGVDLHSKYYQRGETIDGNSQVPAIQPYFELDLPLGFWLGYWGSTVTYGSGAISEEITDGVRTSYSVDPEFGFENDLMAGWGMDFGEFSAKVGGTFFYFQRADENNAAEAFVQAGWSGERMGIEHDVTLMVNLNLYNKVKGMWANNGETYTELIYNAALPKKFVAGLDLGWKTFRNEPEPKTLTAVASHNFSHAIFKLGREVIPNVTLAAEFLYAGWDRYDVKHPNALLWVVSLAK